MKLFKKDGQKYITISDLKAVLAELEKISQIKDVGNYSGSFHGNRVKLYGPDLLAKYPFYTEERDVQQSRYFEYKGMIFNVYDWNESKVNCYDGFIALNIGSTNKLFEDEFAETLLKSL